MILASGPGLDSGTLVTPFPTPASFLNVAILAAGCAVVLLVAAIVCVAVFRSRPLPWWRRKTIACLIAGTIWSALLAGLAWTAYQPYARLGVPHDAPYGVWEGRMGITGLQGAMQASSAFGLCAVLTLALTIVLLGAVLRQIMTHVRTTGVGAHIEAGAES